MEGLEMYAPMQHSCSTEIATFTRRRSGRRRAVSEATDCCQAWTGLSGIAPCSSRASCPRGDRCRPMQGDAIKSAGCDAKRARVTYGAMSVTQIPLHFGRNDANDGRDGGFPARKPRSLAITQELQESARIEGAFPLMFSRKHGSCVNVQTNMQRQTQGEPR